MCVHHRYEILLVFSLEINIYRFILAFAAFHLIDNDSRLIAEETLSRDAQHGCRIKSCILSAVH